MLKGGQVRRLLIEVDVPEAILGLKETIRLVVISKERHLLGRPGDRCYHPLCDHVIEGVLYLISVLYGYLPLGMLDGVYVRVGPDGIGTGHVADCVKQGGKGTFEGNYVLGCHIRKYSRLGQVRVMGFKC